MVGKLNLSGTLKIISNTSVIIEITGENANTEQFIQWLNDWLEFCHGLTIIISHQTPILFHDFVILTENSTVTDPGNSSSFRSPSTYWRRFLKSVFQSSH